MPGLTIYLAKDSVDDVIDLVRDLNRVRMRTVEVDGRYIGELFIEKKEPRSPSWSHFFLDSNIQIKELGSSQSAGAALLLEVGDRIMAVTFGTGHNVLDKEKVEDRFGLLVVLNSIDSDKIKSIDRDSFDAILKKSRELSVRDAETSDFGINVEQDLLTRVTGTPRNKKLGKRLTGKESLRAAGQFHIKDTPRLLLRYLDRFRDTVYKEDFGWIDNVFQVKKKEMTNELDLLLETHLANEDFANIWLAAPDIIDWGRISRFRYGFGRSPVIYDMHLSSARKALKGKPLTVDRLRRSYVEALDLNDIQIDRWPLYRCLHAEINHDGSVFLLSNAQWYQADPAFTQRVDNAVEQIPLVKMDLPEFDEDNEAHYNQKAAKSSAGYLCLLDRRMIKYGGGNSTVEACDLYSKDGEFIHIKRYSGSSDLSHLFAQGLIAGEAFASDIEFREKVQDLVEFELNETGRHLPRGKYSVVFGFISKSAKELRLPFFAKLNLKNVRRRLVTMGFSVKLTDIPVSERLKTLKVYPNSRKTF